MKAYFWHLFAFAALGALCGIASMWSAYYMLTTPLEEVECPTIELEEQTL
jgi:hypothetical protein